jgi:hypothetical protein
VSRTRTAAVAIVGASLLAFVVAVAPKTWPLFIVFGDLHGALEALDLPYLLVVFVAVLLSLVVAWMVLHWVLASKASKRSAAILATVLAPLLLAIAFCSYALLRESVAENRYLSTSGTPVVVLVERNVDVGGQVGEWTEGTVWTSDRDFSLSQLPSSWPFTWIHSENSSVVVIPPEQLQSLQDELIEGGFFELPEILDPRGSLDHASYTIALSKGPSSWRVFGRLSDDGYPHLGDLVEVLRRYSAIK